MHASSALASFDYGMVPLKGLRQSRRASVSLPALPTKCRFKHFVPFSLTNLLNFNAHPRETAATLRKWQTLYYHLTRLYIQEGFLKSILCRISPELILRRRM